MTTTTRRKLKKIDEIKTKTKTTTATTLSSTTSAWSDIPQRLFTICVGIPIIWKLLQQPVLAYLFFMAAHAACAWEFSFLEPAPAVAAAVIVVDKHKTTSFYHRISFCLISVALASMFPLYDTIFLFLLTLSAGIFVMMHRLHWLTGLLLLTIPFRCWAQLQLRRPDAFIHSVSLLLVVWNTDTGAMLLGRIAGMVHRRYPAYQRCPIPQWVLTISPKKSIEGFVGGILGGVWTVLQWIPWIVQWLAPTTSDTFDVLWITSSWRHRVLLGMVLSVLAIMGDLMESSIKRQSQAKDSGNLLPGHGGILDRLDSSLVAVLCYQILLHHVTTTSTNNNN
jgi:CDP-diglyceride synthetase